MCSGLGEAVSENERGSTMDAEQSVSDVSQPAMRDTHVRVVTGCRAHFGPLSYHPREGRHFGGIGLMLDEPGVDVRVSAQDEGSSNWDGADDVITGAGNDDRIRIVHLLEGLRDRLAPDVLPPLSVEVRRSIPPHQGFGSGTQLALAIVDASLRLLGRECADMRELAVWAGRGQRSAIGLYGYGQGGFLVDAGQQRCSVEPDPRHSGHDRSRTQMGMLACRLPVPETWRFVIVTPRAGRSGLSGSSESAAIAQLPPMPEELSGRLARLVLTEMLPALQEDDLPTFSTALYEYGVAAGKFFAGVQGGIFFDRAIGKLCERLVRDGLERLVQSSWGPSVLIPCADCDEAAGIAERLEGYPEFAELRCRVVSPRNSGREILVGS